MTLDLSRILAEPVDGRFKGFPRAARAMPLRDVGRQGWNLLRGDVPFPVAVVRRSAMHRNSAWMRDFTRATGVRIAPHGKTTMCPQIFARQIDDGAWGITVADLRQLEICASVGVERAIIANQVLAGADIARLIELARERRSLQVFFLVDSLAQLALVDAEARRHPLDAPLRTLLEIGYEGGRTGARSSADAMTLARAIAGTRSVALAGIECYEGLAVSGSEDDAPQVERLLAGVRDVAKRCDAEGLFAASQVILSAGGSAVFDIVARGLPLELQKPVTTILRSGCYVTHDSGTYERFFERVRARSGEPWKSGPGLTAALEVWAQVQSRPETGLAILTMGRRDVSYDRDLPRPLQWFRQGAHDAPQPAPAEWRIVNLNDQHGYLQLPAGAKLEVGDLVGCGISHPCTTFDKWQLLLEVDDDYTVVDGLRTYF
ncbi:MAG TPA: amino acid deaminase [Casimicrobiaceae bacterium]|nr:amino acid deaminase [Casimicrobiaceae bacterium]